MLRRNAIKIPARTLFNGLNNPFEELQEYEWTYDEFKDKGGFMIEFYCGLISLNWRFLITDPVKNNRNYREGLMVELYKAGEQLEVIEVRLLDTILTNRGTFFECHDILTIATSMVADYFGDTAKEFPMRDEFSYQLTKGDSLLM